MLRKVYYSIWNAAIFTIAASLILCACTKEKETKGEELVLKATAATKGTEITNETLNEICVTAVCSDYKKNEFNDISELFSSFLFKNVSFIRDGELFRSYPSYYIPKDNRIVILVATAPSEKELGAKMEWDIGEQYEGNIDLRLRDFKPKKNIADQVEFLYGVGAVSYITDAVQYGEIILEHMLAQVSISATNSNSNYIYNVKGVRLCELCGKASLVTNIKWELSEEKATYEDVYEIPVTLQSNAQSIIHPDSGNAFVIPQVLTPWNPEEDPRNINKGAYISVKLQITNNAGEQVFPSTPGEYEWIAIPFNQVLNEGGNHNIVLDFTNGAGYTAPTSTNPGIKVLGGIIQIQ